MSTAKVGFVKLPEATYNTLKDNQTLDDNTFYFLTDRKELYLGSSLIGTNVDNELSDISENPVQNKVVTEVINKINEKITAGDLDLIFFESLY